MSELSDNLRAYVSALESGDLEKLSAILERAQDDKKLCSAIIDWHGEHDEIKPLTKEEKFKIWKIVQDVLDGGEKC